MKIMGLGIKNKIEEYIFGSSGLEDDAIRKVKNEDRNEDLYLDDASVVVDDLREESEIRTDNRSHFRKISYSK